MVILSTYIFASLLIFLSAGNAFAQNVEAQIKQIRREIKAVNSDNSLKKVVLQNEEFLKNMTDGGGTLTGYFKNGEIRKVVQWIGLSDGKQVKEWFFKNGDLIFASEVFYSYTYDRKKDTYDYSKTTKLWDVYYYFQQKKLIDFSIKGPVFFEVDEDEPAGMLHHEVESLRKLLETKYNKF